VAVAVAGSGCDGMGGVPDPRAAARLTGILSPLPRPPPPRYRAAGKEIAKIALREEYGLHEEALAIYKKFGHHAEALGVLLAPIGDLDRAAEYASRVDQKEIWSQLAAAQLEASLVKDAIDSYIKAGDPAAHEGVIAAAERDGKWDDLVRFLEMARKTLKERAVDSALAYALAQTGRLGELESFVTSPNVADLQHIGDRCVGGAGGGRGQRGHAGARGFEGGATATAFTPLPLTFIRV
jgi:tetratricopeptide (TPR) repeat protein